LTLDLVAGTPVHFSATATGTGPFTYQWLRNQAPIDNATGSTLTLDPATPDDAGSYQVRVKDAAAGPNLQGLAMDLGGHYLYALGAGFTASGSLVVFSSDGLGQLTSVDQSLNLAAGSTGLALDPSGQFLYAVNPAGPSLLGYGFDPETGALTPLTPATLTGGNAPLVFTDTLR